jgi:hypothetical protein
VVARADTRATQAVAALYSGGFLWELAHPDPTQRPVLLGHFMSKRWPPDCAPFRGLILLSPLLIRWEPCGEEVEIYNGSRHGYNPEWDLGPVHTTGWAGRAVWMNPNGPSFDPALVAWFGYTFWPENLEPDDEMMRRPQDFFEAYALYEVDRSNGRVTGVTNYECA